MLQFAYFFEMTLDYHEKILRLFKYVIICDGFQNEYKRKNNLMNVIYYIYMLVYLQKNSKIDKCDIF